MAERSPSDSDKSVSLYEGFLAEREEVLRHKWLMSEKAGRDVGLEAALVDWTLHERETWKKEFLKKRKAG